MSKYTVAKKYLEDYIQNPEYMHSSYVGNVVRTSIKTSIKALEIANRLEQADIKKAIASNYKLDFKNRNIISKEEMGYRDGFLDGYNQALADIRADIRGEENGE